MRKTDSWIDALDDAPKPEFTSDERAWLGMGSDAAAEQRAARSAAAMVQKTYAIRPFPATASRVIDLTGRADTKVRDVVRVIETDPTLATRLLRYVNSAACGLKVRCKSLYHAVTLLGPRRVRELVTSTAVLSMFERGDALSTEVLEHAAVTGALARLVGEQFGLPSEEMLACGLLHDLGKLMLLDAGDLSYAPLLGIAPDDETLCKLEREQYGFDHAVLAGQMLLKWNIPSPIPRVVAWHHQPGRAHHAGGRVALMVEVLRLADQVAEAFQSRAPEESRELVVRRIAEGPSATYLGIEEHVLARLWPVFDRTQRESRALFHGDEVPLEELPSIDLRPSARHRGEESAPTEDPGAATHCAFCNEATYGVQCPTCRRPLCEAHEPGLGFCADCEERFAAERDPAQTALTGGMVIGGGATALFIVFAAFMEADVTVGFGAALAGCLASGAGAAVRRWMRRRSFKAPRYEAEHADRRPTAVVHGAVFEAPLVAAATPDPYGKRLLTPADMSGLVPVAARLVLADDTGSEAPARVAAAAEVEHDPHDLYAPVIPPPPAAPRFVDSEPPLSVEDHEWEAVSSGRRGEAQPTREEDPDPTRELRDDVDPASEWLLPRPPRPSISVPYGEAAWTPSGSRVPVLRGKPASGRVSRATLVPVATGAPIESRIQRQGGAGKRRKSRRLARVG